MGHCSSKELPPAVLMTNKCENGNVKQELNAGENSTSNSFTRQLSFRSLKGNSTSWVSGRFGGKKQKNKDLSAAFNILESEVKGKLVNINTATEEELMTLNGISRHLARSIIDYRNTLGGFRRIEDLVLVSGIGASALQNIINDVTIKKHSRDSFGSSSRNPSMDSIPSSTSLKSQMSSHSLGCNGLSTKSAGYSGVKTINVNNASIFDLMNIKGMTQEIAANIVHYRSKKGTFRTIEELTRVKGLNHRSLGLLKVYLTCEPVSPTSISNSISCDNSYKVSTPFALRKITGHRRSYSAPSQPNSNNTNESVRQYANPGVTNAVQFSSEFSADLFELLSLRSERPHWYKVFKGFHQGRSAIRIGSWNLQNLTNEKISNPGVLEVVCRTILESGFSVIALQEVIHATAVEKICSELNCGSLRRIREWSGPKSDWKWKVSSQPVFKSRSYVEYGAFIYNANHGVSLVDDFVLSIQNFNGNKYSGTFPFPYLGSFKVESLSFVLINVHLRIRKTDNQKILEEEEELEEETRKSASEIDRINGNCDQSVDRGNDSPPINPYEYTTLKPLIDALKSKVEEEKFTVYLGTLGLPEKHPILGVLRDSHHCSVFTQCDVTNISLECPKGTELLDNIWLSSFLNKLSTGSCGVIRSGLWHMAIPHGWQWGGFVSDHCPIYCDLFVSGEAVNVGEPVADVALPKCENLTEERQRLLSSGETDPDPKHDKNERYK